MLSNTTQINDWIKACNRVQYKQAVRNLKDIYADAWDYIIEEELAIQFSADAWKHMRLLITKEMNILKRVINAVSMIYKTPAKRAAMVGEEEDEVYKNIIQRIDMTSIMRTVNRMTNLTNATLVRAVWRDGLDLDIINFDNAEILTDPDDWKKIIGIKIFMGHTLNNNTASFMDKATYGEKYRHGYLFTTESEYFSEEYRGKIIKFKSDSKGSEIHESYEDSPYRDDTGAVILPFTLFTKSYPVDCLIDYSTGADLMDINIITALSLIHINNLMKMQSWKQIVITASDLDKVPQAWEIGPERVIRLEAGRDVNPTVTTLDLQANITALYEVIMKRVGNVIAQYGIDQDSFTRSGSPQSGYALKVKKEGLLEIREEQLPGYRHGEHDLFKVMRIVNNYHSPKKINDNAEFSIDFAEMDFPSNQDEENRDWILKITQGVKSVADWVQYINPDIDHDEAVNLVNENRAINEASGFNTVNTNTLNERITT